MESCWLFTTGRDLQRISGNITSKVGHLSMKELVSNSVRKVILDAKVGPPSYEKGLAKDILSVIERTKCYNCLVWAKSDNLVRDIMRLSSNVSAGYIIMVDRSTGFRTNLLRIRKAGVVGVYHPLIDEKLVRTFHGRNKRVFAWTVDDEDSMRKMLHERVDAVVTSNPILFQRVMQDIRTQCLEEGFSLIR
ncbi:glycerophosphodiester phosphodiesterase GDPD4 [Citrus sinensis]|nr:glycerophosphodiester phosphodiesterase GDPD4 [Citrus sinensis]